MSEQVSGLEDMARRLSTTDLTELRYRLVNLRDPVDDHDLIDQIDELERLKSATCAAQARLADELSRRRRTTRGQISASAAREVGLARRESPHAGGRLTKLARALVHDLPSTYLAMACGDINERRAQIIADETRHLSGEDRAAVDLKIADQLSGLGDKALTRKVRREVLRIDEQAALKRRQAAQAGRRVTSRLTGDGVGEIKLVVSDVQLAAIMRSLETHAASAQATGNNGDEADERTRGQVMADEAAARLSGLSQAGPAVMLDLVVSSETLLGGEPTPGELPGIGPIPASVARSLAAASDPVRSRLRRLFATPEQGTLVAMESSHRCFPTGLRAFIRLRDQTCRTPYCDAPVRHIDHVIAWSLAGLTLGLNGQGLCEWCNYAKEKGNWSHAPDFGPGTSHDVLTTTPTGHQHRSREPGQPVPPKKTTLNDYILAT